jgi:hypothetical protein
MPEKPTHVALAMVATKTDRLPRKETILQSLRDHIGEGVVPEEVEWDKTHLLFPLADANVIVSLLPVPIPWSQLEGPCATAFWWPQATLIMRAHKFHFLVAVTAGSFNPIERRVVLTHIVRSVARTADAAGIYWGDGTLVHDPKTFIQQSATISTDRLDLSLWIDIRVEPNGDGTCRCFTTGLTKLGFMEIEVERTKHPPDDLYQFIGDTATYMVTQNVRINDRENIGPTAEERYTVRHKPSMFQRGTVLKILM